MTKALAADARNLQDEGRYRPLGELSDETREITASVQLLRTRVLDAGLREAIDNFIALCRRIAIPPTPSVPQQVLAEIDRRQREILDQYAVLNEQLGEQLRRELDRRDLALDPPAGEDPQ